MYVLTADQIATAKLASVPTRDLKAGDKILVVGASRKGDDYAVVQSTRTVRVPRTVVHQGLRIDINRAVLIHVTTTTGIRVDVWGDDTVTVLTF